VNGNILVASLTPLVAGGVARVTLTLRDELLRNMYRMG